MQMNQYAWIVLAPFPASQTTALQRRLEKASGKRVSFLLLEDLENPETLQLIETRTDEIFVLDALHATEPHSVTTSLKLLLRHFPGRPFVVMGTDVLRRIEIPDYLGRGQILPCGDDGMPLASEDATDDDRELLRYARKVKPRYRYEDLVLGHRAKLRFDEVLSYLRSRERCDKDWGFHEAHSRGHGVTSLFHGPSGTGKTMAAEVLATETGMSLYQVDLASLTSKWVGETEKNLRAIFRAAEGVNGILLFDEGDALFGQRTEIQGGSDRYANSEVNSLLQELEAFRGTAVLSTNHERNLDDAFLRRFTFSLLFGHPTPPLRQKIWAVAMPKRVPLGSDVDFERLSKFPLSGGNIRNCVRQAAARAMGAARTEVGQVDLLWAVKRELQKYQVELPRELVGEDYWRLVASEWELAPRPRTANVAQVDG